MEGNEIRSIYTYMLMGWNETALEITEEKKKRKLKRKS